MVLPVFKTLSFDKRYVCSDCLYDRERIKGQIPTCTSGYSTATFDGSRVACRGYLIRSCVFRIAINCFLEYSVTFHSDSFQITASLLQLISTPVAQASLHISERPPVPGNFQPNAKVLVSVATR